MGNATDLPLRLHKANLELQLRIGRLLQEGGQQWIELGARAVGDTLAESDAEARELLRSRDWQALAALPADAFWRQMQQRLGDGQALSQIAVSAHNAFSTGLLEALQAWQADTAAALSDAGAGALPRNDPSWAALSRQWEQFVSAFVPGAGGSRGRGG